MDFHALPRRDLQALCKRNGVRANMTNAAMAEALAALATVDGIEEFVTQPAAPPAPAAKSAVKAVAEEDPREKKASPLPRGRHVTVSSPEVINLEDSEEEAPVEQKETLPRRGRRGTVRSSEHVRSDDGEEEEKQDENAPAIGEGRRGASRRSRVAEPVAAPTTRRRAAPASKIEETGDVAAEAPPAPTTRRRAKTSTEAAPARTTRRRAQSAVPALAEVEKVPRGRRTTRRTAARKPDIQQEQEEEECLQDVIPVVESDESAPVSDSGCDDTDELEETREPLAVEENRAPEEKVREEEEIEEEEPVQIVEAVAQECSPDAIVQEKLIQEEEVIEVEAPVEIVDAVAQECSPDAVVEGKPVQEEEEIQVEAPVEIVRAVAQECSPDAVVEEEPVQEEEGIEVEVPAEIVEAVAQECSPDAVVEEKQVEVEQLVSPDDSPIFGLVSGTAAVKESEETPVCNSEIAMDKLVTEESCDKITEEKEAMVDDEAAPHATVICSEPTAEDAEEEDAVVDVNEAGFSVKEIGADIVLTEYADEDIQLDFPADVSFADEESGVVATEASVDNVIQLDFLAKINGSGEEEDAVEALNEAGFAVEDNGTENFDKLNGTLTKDDDSAIQLDFSADISIADEKEEVVSTEHVLQSSPTEKEAATEGAEFTDNVVHSSEEEDALVNETGFAVEEKGDETVDEPQDKQTNATQLDFTEEVSCAVEGEGIVAGKDVQQSSEIVQDDFNSEICHAVEHHEMVTVESVLTEKEDVREDNVFTAGVLALKFNGLGNLGDHKTSVVQEEAQTLPLSTEMLNNVTDNLPTTVTAAEAIVSEAMDVSSGFTHGSSNTRSIELAAMEDGNEVKAVEKQKKDPHSLRSLRAKLKEILTANQKPKEAKRVALARLDENVC